MLAAKPVPFVSWALPRSRKRWPLCTVRVAPRWLHRPRQWRDHDEMTDSSGSSFPVSRAAGVAPGDVAGREFSHAKRGYEESEVRAFLRTVADELSSLGDREAGLVARMRSLE